MNQINPSKLLHSKWTAIDPKNREKHFIVTKVHKDDEEQIQACDLEAVLSHKVYPIDWRDLKNQQQWLMGWK